MRKKVFKVTLGLFVSLLMTIIIAIFQKVSFNVLIDNLTWMTIIIATYIVIDDPIYLLFNNRKLLFNKPYLFGLGVYLSSIIMFEIAYFTNNSSLEILFLVLAGITLIGGIVYSYNMYHNPVFTCIEKQRYLIAILKDKIDNGMNKETVERELSHFLKFRLEGDNLEGPIDVNRPFHSDDNAIYTLADLILLNKDGALDAKVIATTTYIKNLVEQIDFS